MTGFLPRRWPILPTIIVLLAVAAMVGLGIWQLGRRDQKEALISTLGANPSMPAARYPELGPMPPELLFRRSSLHCLAVDSWTVEAGRAADGSPGFRYIAHCITGAEGPGALVAVGIAGKPDLQPQWRGGDVEGWIAEEPDHRSLIAHITGPKIVLRPMLIARTSPVEGMKSAAPPRVDDIPNNHLAYAVQWFCFAAIALVIYVLALRRRDAKTESDS